MASKKQAVKARGASRGAVKKSPRKAASKIRKPAALNLGLPRIGADWKAQGGVFMGIVLGEAGQPDYALVASVEGCSGIKGPWGPMGKLAGALSHYDGRANTEAMAEAGSTIAQQALAFRNGPHRDYYIASRHEARIAAANANGLLDKAWLWTSTQRAFNGGYAWLQIFEDGYQIYNRKSHSYGVVLVRRVPIQ